METIMDNESSQPHAHETFQVMSNEEQFPSENKKIPMNAFVMLSLMVGGDAFWYQEGK